MGTWIGLSLAMVSAVVVNWAYTREHDAAARLPPLSPRRPRESVALLLGHPVWLRGFAAETAGWLVYVAALRLAPLALVQAVGASGIAVLALLTSRMRVSGLVLREQLAVLVALVGLLLLSLSLVGAHPADHPPDPFATAVWLGACAGGALLLAGARLRMKRAAPLGFAAGLLFAGGDISAKLVVYGGGWLLALTSLVVCYGLGTLALQSAFQHGDALTGAGIATLTTNAVPIAAGFVLFDEALPHGANGVLQIAAFATTVLGATALADPRARD